MLGILRTPPFRSFQKVAGLTTFDINTIAIGLELVALGGVKPIAMSVKWTPPKKPREAVEQTRRFALVALLTHVVDAIDSLLRDYADLDWIALTDPVKDILRKSVTKNGGVEWSIPERFQQLIRRPEDMIDSIAFLDLAVNWRNGLVHSNRPKRRLPASITKRLIGNKQALSLKYAGIDIERTLANFEAGGWPSLKEATTMIAVAQNLVRAIDRDLLIASAGTAEQVELIARSEIGKALARFELGWKRVWGRNTAARQRVLTNVLNNAGIVETPEPISATLAPTFVSDLASSDKSAIEDLISPWKNVGLTNVQQF